MNKYFNFKKKELNASELEKQNKIKLILYVAFFVILIVVVRLSNNNTNTNKNDPQMNNDRTEDQVILLLDELKENNYEVNINLIIDSDMVNIVRRMQDADTEIFYIKYRGNENVYFRNKDNYYILEGEEITKTNDYEKLFNYDETFLNPTNLVKLLEKNSSSFINMTEEKYNIRRYKISLQNILTMYNEINSSNEFTSLTKEDSIDIRYTDKLKGIFINLTNFNNYITNSDNTVITYELTFDDIGSVSLTDLIEGTNKIE